MTPFTSIALVAKNLRWVFSNFKIFAVVFVSYFLLMDIHWWETLGTILIYMGITGDYVLSHTAQLVTKQLGELDDTLHLYRTGGEEFTILFTGYTTEQAAPLVHSIAQRVREAHFSHDGHQISISISAGVTQLHTDDDQRVDIFHRADRNLYHSKQTGRDRVTIQ
ncbi:GGDEF domain-containing protein [Levilactobacillus brevis]|nr:GGDEF domain-containing protein [Levilactobacillus brevis]